MIDGAVKMKTQTNKKNSMKIIWKYLSGVETIWILRGEIGETASNLYCEHLDIYIKRKREIFLVMCLQAKNLGAGLIFKYFLCGWVDV